MSEILDAARAHFARLRGQTIEIPEWGEPGRPLVARFDPPTLRVRQEIARRAGKSDARATVLTVILCLKDGGGRPLFEDNAETLAALESDADPAVISRIAARILMVSDAAALGN